jgi:DNA invertase Pin-like site-specific DNA recombinase
VGDPLSWHHLGRLIRAEEPVLGRARVTITRSQAARARELYVAGTPIETIAAQVGLSRSTLYRRVLRGPDGTLPATPAPKPGQRIPVPEEVAERARALHAEGTPVRTILAATGLSRMVFYRRVLPAGRAEP